MEKGKISIIMSIYNCAPYLCDAIDSILNQTYRNWDLILCDDASTDDTYKIAKSYQERYPDKIILIQNESNRKLSFSLNRCLEYATGEYIARMDGDDKCLPTRFEKQISFLQENPELDLVGTAMQRFDETGLSIINYSVDHPDYYTLRDRIPFHHATILTYKYVYDTLKGYTVAKRTNRGQDYDLWFRFYRAGFKGDNLREPLYLVREDSNAIRRRTASVRWNALKTTYYGFNLLNYPKWWLIKPTLVCLIKSITPFKIIELYRRHQKKKLA